MSYKKENILKIILSILLICIISAGFIYYSIKNKEVDLDINSSLVQNLYNSVNPSSDATVLHGLCDEKISNSYILAIGIIESIKNQSEIPKTIPKEKVTEAIYKTLGFDTIFYHENVLILIPNICGYEYLPTQDKYKLSDGCGGNSREKFLRKIIEAKETKEKIQIIEKSIYISYDWDDEINHISIYNNYNKEKKLHYTEIPSNEIYDISLDDYMEQASTYVYTFYKQNDTYIFEGLKKINSN